MTKSATDVMHEIIVSAVLDSIAALKAASKGMPNTLARDLNAIHANTTFPDLPPGLRTAIDASVRAAFTRLQREGYSVASGLGTPPRTPALRAPAPRAPAPRNPPPRHDAGGPVKRDRKPPTKRDGNEPTGPRPGGGGRPNRKPGPR